MRSLARSCSRPSLIYFRLRRLSIDRIPAEGPVILAANHRSFSDPFFMGMCIGRPLRFVAKVELFDRRWKAWLLLALGAFPIKRGDSDEQSMETARILLEQGHALGIFPEGTRVRPGPLGEPQAGRRSAGARDGRAGRADRADRQRGHSRRLAHPAAQGDRPLRRAAHLPALARGRDGEARDRGHQPGLVGGLDAVGGTRRGRSRPRGCRRRRRQLGDGGLDAAGARRRVGPARLPQPATGGRDRPSRAPTCATCRASSCPTA